MNARHLLAGLLASAIALTALPAIAQADDTKVMIGLSAKFAPFLVPVLAQQEGLFAKYGVNNVEVTFGPGPQTSAALAGGAFNFTTTAAPSVDLVGMTSGRVKILAVWQTHSGQSLMGAPGINSVKDLKGHKVAISGGKGSATAMLVAAALQREGMSLDDVTLIALQDSAAATKAFLSGQVDAVAAFPPNTIKLMDGVPGTKVIEEFNDIVLPGAQFSVNDNWAKEHPELVVGVLHALDDAIQIFRTDPAKVKKLIGEQLNLADNQPVVDILYDYSVGNMTEHLVVVDEEMEKGILALLRLNGFAEATDDTVTKIVAPDYGNKAFPK